MELEEYERVVIEQKDRVYGYAAMILRDPGEGQDVAQEALIRLWQHRDGVEVSGAPLWLRRTAHNLCIDRLRRRKTRPEVATDQLDLAGSDPAPGPEQLAASGDLGRQIEQALARLSDLDRAVLVLREVQCLPYAEIAGILDLPLGTLKARLHRAREQLRKRLQRVGVTR